MRGNCGNRQDEMIEDIGKLKGGVEKTSYSMLNT